MSTWNQFLLELSFLCTRDPALIKDTKSILENFALTVTFDFEIVHDHYNPLFKIHSMGLVQVR